MNLKGEFINHKSFGRGKIVEQGTAFVTVLFSATKEKKKFIYPSAIGLFLMLENVETSKEYKKFSDELAFDNEAAQAAAVERQALAKHAIQEHAKALKKANKKPVKKATPVNSACCLD